MSPLIVKDTSLESAPRMWSQLYSDATLSGRVEGEGEGVGGNANGVNLISAPQPHPRTKNDRMRRATFVGKT